MQNIKIAISCDGTEILTYFAPLEPLAITNLVEDIGKSVRGSVSDWDRIRKLENEVKALKGESNE